MKCPDSTSYLYPTYFHTKLFGILLHVAGHQWFNTNIAADDFDICVHWLSYLVNQSPYTEALFEFDADQNIAILTDAGICAAHSVTSGYAFNLRRQCRSLAETRFYYDYVLSEDQISVDDSTFKTLALLPERFFIEAYAAATAFRLTAEFEQRWSKFHDHRWRRH